MLVDKKQLSSAYIQRQLAACQPQPDCVYKQIKALRISKLAHFCKSINKIEIKSKFNFQFSLIVRRILSKTIDSSLVLNGCFHKSHICLLDADSGR